jgi:hypothetical protein
MTLPRDGFSHDSPMSLTFKRITPRLILVWWGQTALPCTEEQRRVLQYLLKARARGIREVGRRKLLRVSRARECRQLGEVFIGSGMWGVLLVEGRRRGCMRLAELIAG